MIIRVFPIRLSYNNMFYLFISSQKSFYNQHSFYTVHTISFIRTINLGSIAMTSCFFHIVNLCFCGSSVKYSSVLWSTILVRVKKTILVYSLCVPSFSILCKRDFANWAIVLLEHWFFISRNVLCPINIF